MPEAPNTSPGGDPTPEELAEILANLDFYRDMDDADALPLEDGEDTGKEEKSHE